MAKIARGRKTYEIPAHWFESLRLLKRRIEKAPASARARVSHALRYMYFKTGPKNLPRAYMVEALPYLSLAEQKAIRWLQTRTNGNNRRRYGHLALVAARRARMRC